MTLGQRIQQIRLEHYLSQEEFGERLDVSRQTVSKWELDQTYPELSKIVLISRLFSVTTDSLLIQGISTFDWQVEEYICGVYRSSQAEVVETEKFALMCYFTPGKDILGMTLFYGLKDKKYMRAICERDQKNQKTAYAYKTESNEIVSNDRSNGLISLLGSRFDPGIIEKMRRLEVFKVDHSGKSLPIVGEAGIQKCLKQWRMADSLYATLSKFNFSLCTGKTEYIFSIAPKDDNIYCGASYNKVFDLGMFSGGQFFRIRNYKNNSQPWCGFQCDFSFEDRQINIPINECELGKCIQSSKGLMWCIKRYTDDEIVLQGCGDDEYTYKRTDRRTETFAELLM